VIVAYEVDCQPCLRKEGKEVIGPQGAAILRSIANGSSLTRTAKALNISARKARERIRQMEAAYGSQLISNRKGSALKLSEQGARLLDIYENHSSAIEEQVRRRFKNPILTVDGILVLEDGIVLVRRDS
jgi:molybdate transport repressor ModE-like protein